jgi:DHA2 family multidrug resistance protein
VFGFATLGIALGALQMMLDRGQQRDWFSSTEICLELAATLFFGYLFIVQMLTAERPFINSAIFADRNFVSCNIIGLLIGILVYGVASLIPELLERLMGYPVVTTGVTMMSRGVGSFLASSAAGPLSRRIDGRIMIFAGLCCNAVSMFMLSHGLSLQADGNVFVIAGFIQGIGTSLTFAPLAMLAFVTLEARYRSEGAAVFTLVRSLGGSIGISLLQVLTYRTSAVVQSRLTEGLRPDNPVVETMSKTFSLTEPSGVAALVREVGRQAQMVGFIDGFWVLGVFTMICTALIFFMRAPRHPGVHVVSGSAE